MIELTIKVFIGFLFVSWILGIISMPLLEKLLDSKKKNGSNEIR